MREHADPLSEPLPENPLPLLGVWLARARAELAAHNPSAMTLATVSERGAPNARMVICRGYDEPAGWLVFYTDRDSRKGRELATTPRAAGIFYWDAFQWQVRIEGPVVESPESESDAYFASRPAGAQVSATASLQSQPLASRADLVAQHQRAAARLGAPIDGRDPAKVLRPERWGGYRIWLESIEFWVGRADRLHDRALYRRQLSAADAGFTGSRWTATRLQP